ncbi:DUF1616 domain-containing protein [Natronolimnobius baerhuensis]|uniref:DUF1616 domain-containing protein n=1 Tax=Natronolimnobius baerhuensis TaxID=253108 RepID=A0A202EB12_9EURY|nr:DUF1616 domain-containing protein [Natronolimnobius baerhuensis]OVE85160.1 hypothetical protein B2G88_12535 [Natronolimnobius baerhuensis]
MSNRQLHRDHRWWRLRAVPVDLVGITALTICTVGLSLFPGLRGTALHLVAGVLFVLFAPGYAFVAALFPAAGTSPTAQDASVPPTTTETAGTDSSVAHPAAAASRRDGIDGLERLILSAALSVALVPVVGVGLHVTPWGIQPETVTVALGGLVLVGTGVAAIRRLRLPPEDRFRVPYRRWLAVARDGVVHPPTRVDGVLNIIVIIAVVLAVSTITVAVVAPSAIPGEGSSPGEQFSGIALLTEDDDGDLVADGYPTTLAPGDSTTLVVGLDNHEHRPVEYSVVVLEQQIDRHSETNVTVTEQRELERFETELAHNETWHHRHDVRPTMTGEVRLVWALYLDAVPDDPSTDTAADDVSIWVDVTDSDG